MAFDGTRWVWGLDWNDADLCLDAEDRPVIAFYAYRGHTDSAEPVVARLP